MTAQDMMMKKRKMRDSTELSSSGEMEPSKAPKDILGLGRYLVRELDFEDGVDTLGRWMAHYLAELIHVAENGATEEIRSKACRDASETIIRIWEHRASLPGKAYPLAPYKDVLQVLNRLRPTNNPFSYFGTREGTKKDQISAILFDNLSRLIIALLLMKIPSGELSTEIDPSAVEALSEAEVYVLTAIRQWGELFELSDKSTDRAHKGKRKSEPEVVNLDRVAIKLIDTITTALIELRGEFKEEG